MATSAGRRPRRGIRLHRSPSLAHAATTDRAGIAVTTAQRTLADLRRTEPAAELRNAVRAAEAAGIDVGEHAELIERTFSELEIRFLALCRRHRLPRPEVNVRVGSYRVDFFWRQARLIVETDGWRYHRGELANAEDGRRDRELQRLGCEVLRFTWEDVVTERRRSAGIVRARLKVRAG